MARGSSERGDRLVALPRPFICVVTRARGASGSTERTILLRRLGAAAAAGASMIQVRERHLDDRALTVFVQELMSSTAKTSCAVLVNDRTDIALASGAAGVHLKSGGVGAGEVRRIVPAEFLVGCSIHSREEACQVERAGGCDYLTFGTVFPSPSKPEDHPVAGVEALRRVCASVSLPVIAIGGITPAVAAEVASTGAAGVAAISLFADSPDVSLAVGELRLALTRPPGRV